MEAKRAYMCKERIVDLEFKISRLVEVESCQKTFQRLLGSGFHHIPDTSSDRSEALLPLCAKGLLGKACYDLVQIKLKRHRNQIATARTQNLLLHAALDTLRHKARIARKNLGDLENLRKTVASLRVTYDHQRKLVFSRQKKLEAQVTDTHSAEIECAGVLDPNTPDLIRIRQLEAKLNAVRLKTKDVQILMRHYEATLKPMKEEYTSYSAKIEAVQNILNIKRAECEKLINSHHDAIRARDAAKKELEELIGKLFGKDGRDMVSPELQNKILAAIKEIKDVMEVRSMREMYHQLILQEKQSGYLESIYVELKRTVDQLKNEYPPRRKSSLQPHAVHNMIEGTKLMVRRQSSRRGSIPLLQILEGTQKLVDRLHEGNLTMPSEEGETKQVLTKCQERISNLVQALHRKMKHINKEAHRKAKEDAKAIGRAYVREARFVEFDSEDDARKAAKEKHTADVKREIEAREAEALRKEEKRLAAREERRAQIRAEIEEVRQTSRKEAQAQAEAFRKWQKENEPARVNMGGAAKEKGVKTPENINHAAVPSGPALEGKSPAEPAQVEPKDLATAEVSSSKNDAQTEEKKEEHPTAEAPALTDEKTEGTPPVAEKSEASDVGAPFSPLSEAKVASPTSTEPEIQLQAGPSSKQHEVNIGPPETAPMVMVTFTCKGADTEEVQVHLLVAVEDEDKMSEEATSAVPAPSAPEHVQPPEQEGTQLEILSPASPSSSEHESTEPAE